MPERIFMRYWRHAQRHALPLRRLQLQLGQIAMLIAQTMGGATEVTLQDFLFDPKPERDDMTDEEEAKQFFGFSPRVKD